MQINDSVMYHQSQSDKDTNAFRCGSVEFPIPAIVTAIHDDGTVDVDVIEAGGRTLGRQRVAATVIQEPGAGYVVPAKVHGDAETTDGQAVETEAPAVTTKKAKAKAKA